MFWKFARMLPKNATKIKTLDGVTYYKSKEGDYYATANNPDLNEEDVNWLPGRNYCGNHPHNFYVQLFAETGILGLIFGTLMFYNIISKCYNKINRNVNCPMYTISYIVPFAIFFPIQQYGSFFGQWGNLFIWFSIGFALSQTQINNKQ